MPPPPSAARTFVRRYQSLVHDEIWRHASLADRTPRGRFFALLRVLSITGQGTFKNKIFTEAAALGYYSLISLGPIVSLAIIISSFFVHKSGENFATQMLNSVINFIAPPSKVYSEYELRSHENGGGLSAELPAAAPATDAGPPPPAADAGASAAATGTTAGPDGTAAESFNPALVKLINDLVAGASSSKVGFIGLLVLIVICIQLIITIENTFNSIWGVRRGRSWFQRIVMYWAIISLGVLVAVTAGTLLSASAVVKRFDYIPAWLQFEFLKGLMPHLLSYGMVAGLLAIFYRFIPNTPVRWVPAFVGGLATALLLTLNNYLSFLYVSRVINAQSLFGSIGIFPVLMFGLYIFWLLILLGGQLTYAVQNANFLTDDRLWHKVSPRVRRLVSLAAFLQVARAFQRGQDGPTAAELAERLRVPGNILNECVTRLCDLHLVSVVEAPDQHGEMMLRYQPGRPLDRLTLGELHEELDNLGTRDGEEVLHEAEPVLRDYLGALARFAAGPNLRQTFAALLADGAAPESAPRALPALGADRAATA